MKDNIGIVAGIAVGLGVVEVSTHCHDICCVKSSWCATTWVWFSDDIFIDNGYEDG